MHGRFLLLIVLIGTMPAAAQPVQVRADVLGLPGDGAAADLYLPPGPGAHPAVVLLHGCSGITSTVRNWATRLTQWGYAALVLDGFAPRGVDDVCGEAGRVAPGTRTEKASRVPPRIRAHDAFRAAAYLRARSDIQGERISAVGFSHGGTTALAVASRAMAAHEAAPPFAAVAAFYPWCPPAPCPSASPTLVLIDDGDDWTPAERCIQRQAGWRVENGVFRVQVYPGATHAFDSPSRERIYDGHTLRHDATATADAAERLHAFLDAPPR